MNINAEMLYAQAMDRKNALSKKRIVAEISKSWPTMDEKDSSISAARFEQCIEENRKRGYLLES